MSKFKKVFTSILSLALLETSMSGNLITILAQEEMEEDSITTMTEENSLVLLEDNEVPLDSARSIALNSSVIGSLESSYSAQWYKITLTSPGKVNFEFSHPYIESGNTYWTIQFYGKEMQEREKIEAKGNVVKCESSSLGLAAGTYYIKVSNGYYFSEDSYTLKVSYTSSNVWEKEPNDTYQTATPISTNTTWYGAMTYNYSADWYTFDLNSSGYMELEFNHSYSESGSVYWTLEVYNPDFKVVDTIEVKGNSPITKDVKIGLSKGKYYLKIYSNYSHDWGDYNFKVNFHPSNSWEVELNDSISTATPLNVGSSKNGAIENRNDSDWYAINLPNGEYTLSFSSNLLNPDTKHWKVELYNNDQTNKIDHEFSKNDSWNFSITGSGSDQFYICVKSTYSLSRSNYTLSVVKRGDPIPTDSIEDDLNIDIPEGGQAMYRLYNPNSGEHHYTSDEQEKNNLTKLGWKYEGVGWIAPITSQTPVYRLYNKNSGDHHYTADSKEKEALIKLGWKDEGIGWYSDDNNSIPLYRQYNPNASVGNHNYTLDKKENDNLVKMGWKAEGISWYGMAN